MGGCSVFMPMMKERVISKNTQITQGQAE
jgi:hypothetical protein